MLSADTAKPGFRTALQLKVKADVPFISYVADLQVGLEIRLEVDDAKVLAVGMPDGMVHEGKTLAFPVAGVHQSGCRKLPARNCFIAFPIDTIGHMQIWEILADQQREPQRQGDMVHGSQRLGAFNG